MIRNTAQWIELIHEALFEEKIIFNPELKTAQMNTIVNILTL